MILLEKKYKKSITKELRFFEEVSKDFWINQSINRNIIRMNHSTIKVHLKLNQE